MNILVTGASKGIGRAITKQLLENSGPNRVIIIARDYERLLEIKEDPRYKDSASHIIPIPFDLTDSSGISDQLMPKIENHFDHLDILINNAGYLYNTTMMEMSREEFKRHFEINLFSVAELIKGCVQLMQSSEIKHIVNVGTMGAIQKRKKYPGLSAYSSSKAALAALTELLYEELKPYGITINYLALGAVETEMFKEAFPDGKAPLTPDEIAKYIAEFALQDWKYMNGKIVEVSLK